MLSFRTISCNILLAVAINQLPNFTATPSNRQPGPQHRGTIHLNCEHPQLIHDAYVDITKGEISKRYVLRIYKCNPDQN